MGGGKMTDEISAEIILLEAEREIDRLRNEIKRLQATLDKLTSTA
jgi:hypothetical protein